MRRPVLAAAASLLLSNLAHAHFMWLEIPPDEPNSVRLRFTEEILEATPQDMQELAAPMTVTTADGDPVALAMGEEYLRGEIPAGTKSVIGTLDYGVLDRSEAGRGQFMLKYHARAAVDARSASIESSQPVDVVAAVVGDSMGVMVTMDGEPVEGAEIVAVLPHLLEPVEATTDADGRASFTVQTGDWVAMRAMVSEEATGEHDGQAYTLVHHYSTLTFFNTGL